jgi:hypothetical protein
VTEDPERAGADRSPPWRSLLPDDLPAAVTRTPAGLWVRRPGGPPAGPADPGFTVPPTGGRPVLLIGRPGEPAPAVAAVAGLVDTLSPELRDRWVLVPYGPMPAGEAVGQQLADRLGRTVRARHGLPRRHADGTVTSAAVDADGRSTWTPFVSVTAYHPGGPRPTALTWSPLPGLDADGPAVQRLTPGWLVELLPGGLVLRPRRTPVAGWLTRRGTDPDQVDLVVLSGYVPVPAIAAAGRLVRALPAEVRIRLRLLVVGSAPDAVRIARAGLSAELGLPPYRLEADGSATAVEPGPRVGRGRHRAAGVPDGERQRVPAGRAAGDPGDDGGVPDGVLRCG